MDLILRGITVYRPETTSEQIGSLKDNNVSVTTENIGDLISFYIISLELTLRDKFLNIEEKKQSTCLLNQLDSFENYILTLIRAKIGGLDIDPADKKMLITAFDDSLESDAIQKKSLSQFIDDLIGKTLIKHPRLEKHILQAADEINKHVMQKLPYLSFSTPAREAIDQVLNGVKIIIVDRFTLA